MINTPPLHEDRLHAMMRLLRPQQWIKNLFVFGPIIFGGALFRGEALLAGLVTFFAFSFAASSIYCFNDIHDLPDDIRHPEKCHRPIASGVVTVGQAYGLMVLMFALSMLASLLAGHLCVTINPLSGTWSACSVAGVILIYWLLNLAYCARLKQFAIIDVCIVAFGFVLRLFAGGAATGLSLIHISEPTRPY